MNCGLSSGVDDCIGEFRFWIGKRFMIGDVPGSPAAQRCLLKCLQASAPGVTSNPKTETRIRNLEQTETQTPNLTRNAQSDMRECARDVDNAAPCTPNSNIACIAERKQKKMSQPHMHSRTYLLPSPTLLDINSLKRCKRW